MSPVTSLSTQNGVSWVDADNSSIRLQSFSTYGEAVVTVQSLEYSLEPESHDPGGSHLISADLVAKLSGCDTQYLYNLAGTGECFFKLNWIFPGYNYPRFTTRHLLTTGPGTPRGVSFSGDLAWAHRMLKNAQSFQAVNQPVRGGQYLPTPALGSVGGGSKLSLQCPLRSWFPGMPGFGYRPCPDILESPFFTSPAPSEDQLSICSELTSTTTISDSGPDFSNASSPGFIGSFSPEVVDLSSSDCLSPPSSDILGPGQPWTCESCANCEHADYMVQQQMQTEILQRQRREAEAMYARNGDTSGLLAVIAASSHPDASGSWQYTGMPKF